MGISKGLADNCVIARVDGQVFDLDRVLEKSCRLELIKFDDEEGKAVFWHSSAHILGEAMERVYGDHKVSDSDFKVLDNMTKSIVKEKQPFERLEMKKEDLLEMFKYNKFKLRILNERVKTPTTTVYRCGPLIDLCRATYWEGNSEAESLQRIYGISFPDNKLMKEWKLFQEEAAKRDHRKLGREQDLFFFHELSPGSCFFQPKGAHIYNKLIDFIKEEYWERGFKEVISPNIYNANLWKTSGHWDHYAENMFRFEIEKEKFVRSWRDLPIRMSDFGVLHRNELSGALTGLLRVRRFQQDDAHIFCMPNQIKDEMKALSTRPEKFMGDPSVWDQAEKDLTESLNATGLPWKLNPGDGAFYGPKIDVNLTDALRRQHQCGTIQLDFQLPLRFNLNYIDDKGEKKHPVIIHRAILGSVERMFAILTESFGGKWPFWLSPPKKLTEEGFCCEADVDDGSTMNKKKERTQTVNIRTRDNKVHGERSIDDVIAKFKVLSKDRVLNSEEFALDSKSS
ncbi:TARS [Lepeophtheirus salmonis]|uniref:threonine--tRNA ligase n=1 Tax=Lepeophtheirus salmonis TaxID=72036 RepID=A0A7R8H9V7_LEPSM|nr:TARS [Lepeophtheirus salmonis]CAF2947272.1 TARS [Lepeophtheirus salmonis]